MLCSEQFHMQLCPADSARRSLATYNKRKRGLHACSAVKQVWVETSRKEVLTAALEAGASTFLFRPQHADLIQAWQDIAKFDAITVTPDGQLQSSSQEHIGQVVSVAGPGDLKQAEAYSSSNGYVIMDASSWQIIPAENLVAAFQTSQAKLLGVAHNAADARVLLEALEVGTDGVLLRSDDPAEARGVLNYIAELQKQLTDRLELVFAVVTKIGKVGMGDRVAVDFCSLMVPGEGLLVGSYSRGLFLVHSECCESHYINSRPFRVNCGPVHAYVAMPNGRTAYLSELRSGDEVLIVNAQGMQRTGIVGRTKVETRPLVLVEASIKGGQESVSTFLQNAETVRLVAPASTPSPQENADTQESWRSVSVTELHEGDEVLLHRSEGARHTGIAIQETISER